MSLLVRSKGCRTSENRSYRWIAVMTIVAMLGFAGFVLAAAGNNQGEKLVPIAQDVKGAKVMAPVLGDVDPASVPATNSGHPANSPFAIPANDDCTGAIVIPSGSLPVVTAPVDITDATPQGSDDPIFTCATTDQTIWYSFTPVVSGQYIFSTCNGNGATGSTVYDSVIALYNSTGGACPESGAALGCNDTAAGCTANVPGAPYVDQSTVAAVLTAGNTYFVVAGHWSGDAGGVGPGFNAIAIKVDLSPAPDNDTCSAPKPLALDRKVFGTTASATNDYRSASACFTGVGQIPSSSNGLDVVFSFVPPDTGNYSFRYVQDDASAALRSQSPVLYLADNCPAPNNAAPVGGCIKAANRMNDQTTGNGNRSEEINCVALTAGTPYYLFFDDRFTGNPGGDLAVEVTRCVAETEPNNDIASANPYTACFMTGTSNPGGPAGDVDFFSLGTPPAGSKLFVAVDGQAANNSDFEMRITNTTDTLGYDNNDGTSWTGSNSPIIAGPIADGNPIYVRLNTGSAATVANEPYHLYAVVESGPAQNEGGVDVATPGSAPSNGTFYGATQLTGGGFVQGIMASQTDSDCFRFIANEGDNLLMFSDNNPARVPGTVTNVWGVLQTLDGLTPARTRFIGQVVRNIVTPSPGTLTGVTPSVVSEFSDYRASYTGAYMYCYGPTQDINSTENPAASAYPLPYMGSISASCAPIVNSTQFVTDIAVTKTVTGTPKTGGVLDYTITLTNTGSQVAVDTRLVDTLPPQLLFLGLGVDDGFPTGLNTDCIDLPSPGTADAPIDCTTYSIAPGASVTYFLTVQVANCIGSGLEIANTASITTLSVDSNPTNNSASVTVTTTEDGTCADLLCDAGGCILNGCTVNDVCVSGACTSVPRNCNDNSLCTDDSCDPVPTDETNCINDSTQLGDLCNDGNACTGDACDPLLFCIFPPVAAGATCDDFLNCTTPDRCDGLGNCIGLSVCDDGQPCTDDFGDEGNNCACTNDISFAGTICSDNNACTTGETCDGIGPGLANCVGGSTVVCDDNNPCTDDSCDVVTGCVYTNNTSACNDGDACTAGDTCGGGVCNPGAPVVCDDGNGCTDDSCNSATGCVYLNNTAPCNDGNACTTGDTCGGGACIPGGPTNCDDGQCCTIDACNPATGCYYTANTTAPVFASQPSLGNTILWPPNHGYADFTVANTGASATSQCGIAAINFASCASSQSENSVGTGDGNSTRDCVYAPGLLSVRAERDGSCSPTGRVYESRLVAVDVCGNTATSNTFDIGVWHDRGNQPTGATIVHANGGQNESRTGANGTYGTGCGAGSASTNGTIHDHSDADPEMEISQNAAVTVDDLRLEKAAGGNVKLSWYLNHEPGTIVTRFHVYRLDPVTLFWTKVAEVTKQTKSYLDPVLNDAAGYQYKVTAVIK